MHVTMIRAKVKRQFVADVETAVKTMFAAIDDAQPDGVRYASSVLPDGETFVVLLALDDPNANPLVTVPGFGEYQENLKTWLAGPPTVEPLNVVGSYRLF